MVQYIIETTDTETGMMDFWILVTQVAIIAIAAGIVNALYE